jgi:Putative transposase
VHLSYCDQRKELEQLCRYITRPAHRQRTARQVVLQLKSPYKDGTTHIVMEPLEFMERLAAPVPRPCLHLIRFHGVLAPNAKLRSKIVPAPAERATEPPTDHAQGQGEIPCMSWARLQTSLRYRHQTLPELQRRLEFSIGALMIFPGGENGRSKVRKNLVPAIPHREKTSPRFILPGRSGTKNWSSPEKRFRIPTSTGRDKIPS